MCYHYQCCTDDTRFVEAYVDVSQQSARLAQSVEHQTFKATHMSQRESEGQGFESLIGRTFFDISKDEFLPFLLLRRRNQADTAEELDFFWKYTCI